MHARHGDRNGPKLRMMRRATPKSRTMNTTDALTELVSWLFEENPTDSPAIEQRARMLFLDTLGCMIAGLAKPEPQALVKSLSRLESGPILLPGTSASISVNAAAYVTGMAASWDEACEGLPRAHGRPGLHSFAAGFPLALARDHSLGELLAALVAGYEVAGRLGEALRIRPGMHVDGTWGTFGAVTAAARLLGLTPSATVSAIQGAACHLPWSLYLPIAHGANVRNAYIGDAAVRGIMHAIATEAGITTPPNAIETYDELSLGGDPTGKTLAPSGEWLIEQGYLKPFAAVRHVHYGAQAAFIWHQSHGQNGTEDIRALNLFIYAEAITYCSNRSPVTPIQAQFSLSYGIAWALVTGDLAPDAYDVAALNHPEVRRLEALVTITEDPALSNESRRAARLIVETSGDSETILADSVPGEPEYPLSDSFVEGKFVDYATPNIGANRASAIVSALRQATLALSVKEIVSA